VVCDRVMVGAVPAMSIVLIVLGALLTRTTG
jgi:hypothetical protein